MKFIATQPLSHQPISRFIFQIENSESLNLNAQSEFKDHNPPNNELADGAYYTSASYQSQIDQISAQAQQLSVEGRNHMRASVLSGRVEDIAQKAQELYPDIDFNVPDILANYVKLKDQARRDSATRQEQKNAESILTALDETDKPRIIPADELIRQLRMDPSPLPSVSREAFDRTTEFISADKLYPDGNFPKGLILRNRDGSQAQTTLRAMYKKNPSMVYLENPDYVPAPKETIKALNKAHQKINKATREINNFRDIDRTNVEEARAVLDQQDTIQKIHDTAYKLYQEEQPKNPDYKLKNTLDTYEIYLKANLELQPKVQAVEESWAYKLFGSKEKDTPKYVEPPAEKATFREKIGLGNKNLFEGLEERARSNKDNAYTRARRKN